MSTWEITIESTTWEISVDSSVSIVNTPFPVTGVVITPGETTEIDTGQSDRKPKIVSFYDEIQNKCIDKSLPAWTSRQDTNWYIDIPSQLIAYNNITVYWQ